MDKSQQSPSWLSSFPALQLIDDPVWRAAADAAQVIHLPADNTIFQAGDACQNYLLVAEGSVSVHKVTEDGHEIALYHIQPGHSCELTTSCLLAGNDYRVEAVTTTKVCVVLIPKNDFMTAFTGSNGFRKFIYQSIDNGMNELASLVGEVAFGPMEQRLAEHLLDLSQETNRVEVTHYELAVELGSAREVVSRLLKKLERQGWVKLHRGQVEVLEKQQLSELIKYHAE